MLRHISYLLFIIQSAYRAIEHSILLSIPALAAAINDTARAVDANQICALVLLDLSAAFDTVDHSTLLDVLQKRFAVSDRALDWFSSYQSGCKQSVCIGPDQSSSTPLDCGVSQGSIVGPSEFIGYTENIEELIHSHSLTCHLYADDTQLLSSMRLEEIDSRKPALVNCVVSLAVVCTTAFAVECRQV